MTYPLVNGAVINGAEDPAGSLGVDLAVGGAPTAYTALSAEGSIALELGEHRAKIGEDVVITAIGIDLTRVEMHSAVAAQPPMDAVVHVGEGWALGLGSAAVQASVSLDAGSGVALEVGTPGTAVAALADGARSLDCGTPSISFAALAGSGSALSLGAFFVRQGVSVLGIDLVRGGEPAASAAGAAVMPEGAVALEVGAPGALRLGAVVYPGFALQMGAPLIDRGATC